MIGVVIHLEDRWNYTQSDRDIEIMQMFRETAKGLGADFWVVIDKTTDGLLMRQGDADFPCYIYYSLAEALAAYPGYVRLFFEHPGFGAPLPPSGTTLDRLVHPEDNVLYIFGGDEAGIDLSGVSLGPDDRWVYIDLGGFILWQIATLAIALYDRKIRRATSVSHA